MAKKKPTASQGGLAVTGGQPLLLGRPPQFDPANQAREQARFQAIAQQALNAIDR